MLVRELVSARQSVAAGGETPRIERARIERVTRVKGASRRKNGRGGRRRNTGPPSSIQSTSLTPVLAGGNSSRRTSN